MKMQFKVKTLANTAENVGAQQGRIFADLVKSPAVQPDYLIPGRYTIRDAMLYCEPAIIVPGEN